MLAPSHADLVPVQSCGVTGPRVIVGACVVHYLTLSGAVTSAPSLRTGARLALQVPVTFACVAFLPSLQSLCVLVPTGSTL